MAKNRRIRERHFAVDIMASAAGGSLITAASQRSWTFLAAAVAIGVAVYFIDKVGIEAEEKVEKD